MDEQSKKEEAKKPLPRAARTYDRDPMGKIISMEGFEHFHVPYVLTYEKELFEDDPHFVIPKEARIWENQEPRHWYGQRTICELQKRTKAEDEVAMIRQEFDRFVSSMSAKLNRLQGILEDEQIAKWNAEQKGNDVEAKKKADEEKARRRIEEDAEFFADLKAALELMERGYKPSQKAEVIPDAVEPKPKKARQSRPRKGTRAKKAN